MQITELTPGPTPAEVISHGYNTSTGYEAKASFESLTTEQMNLNSDILTADTEMWLAQIPDIVGADKVTRDIGGTGKIDNGGIPRASIDLADSINSGSVPSMLTVRQSGGIGAGAPDRHLSVYEFDGLIDSAPSEGLSMLMSLMKSATYPEEHPEGVVLSARPVSEARQTTKHGGRESFNAVLCGQAEGNFVEARRELEDIYVGDKAVAVKKRLGENVALLTNDAFLNGVHLPKGSIVTVGYDESGESTFGFGRLSAFSLSGRSEIEAAAPYLSNSSRVYENPYGYDELASRLNGPDSPTATGVNSEIAEIIDYLESDDPLSKTIAVLRTAQEGFLRKKEFDAEYAAAASDHYGTVRRREKEATAEVNILEEQGAFLVEGEKIYAKVDVENEKSFRSLRAMKSSTRNPSAVYKNRVQTLTQMFGQETVNDARKFIRFMRLAERVQAD